MHDYINCVRSGTRLFLCCVNGEYLAHLEHEIVGEEGNTQVILHHHHPHTQVFISSSKTVLDIYFMVPIKGNTFSTCCKAVLDAKLSAAPTGCKF